MTNDQLLAGTPFYCYNDKPVTIQQPGGNPFKYDGVFSLARLASPLTIKDENVIDHRGEYFADLLHISEGNFIYIKKPGYGRITIGFDNIHAEPQKQKQ